MADLTDGGPGSGAVKMRVEGGEGDLDAVVEVSEKMWKFILATPDVTMEQLANHADFRDFVKAYTIITRFILEGRIYHRRGFRKYLKNLSGKKRVVGGVSSWFADHREYAKSQIDYIKYVYRAHNINLNSPQMRAYLAEMEKQVEEDIKLVNNAYEALKKENLTGASLTESMREELRRMAASAAINDMI